MAEGRFATAINCMDGRTQLPVIDWLRREYGVDYVDSVTEPGPVCLLAGTPGSPALESVRGRVRISVEKHGSHQVAVVAHHDCAGNPLPKEQQLEQLRCSVETVRGWGLDAEVIGLWVGPDWQVERVL